MIYFSSDFHCGHKNIIRIDGRPFEDLRDMEDKLIARWNTRVKPNDTVYHLGDFAWTFNTALRVIPKLNGHLVFIKGNHDKSWWKPERVAKEIPQANLCNDSIHILHNAEDCPSIVLCHYPMRSWPGSARGSWHLYGHTHRKLSDYGKSMCVCLNVWDYNLVSLDTVREHMNNLPETEDRHGPI